MNTALQPSTLHPPGNRPSAWTLTQWVVIPLLIAVVGELAVRRTADRVPRWYAGAEQIAATNRIDVIFIGSSHVQAAVPVQVFSDTVAERTGTKLHVLNLARGYTTTIEHYLGLRNLIETHPEALRGVTVFQETPGKVDSFSQWSSSWVNVEQYQMVVDLLRASDLARLWREAAEDTPSKAKITARFLMRDLALYNRRERVRDGVLLDWLPASLGLRASERSRVDVVGDDLQGPGLATSIRTDEAALREARAVAAQFGAELAARQQLVSDWSNTVTADMLRLLRSVEGNLVFFVPPESESFQRRYRTAVHRQNAELFSEQVHTWGTCVLQPSFDYTDDDLPDAWHLRVERAPEFTRALVDQWLTACDAPGVPRRGDDARTSVTTRAGGS